MKDEHYSERENFGLGEGSEKITAVSATGTKAAETPGFERFLCRRDNSLYFVIGKIRIGVFWQKADSINFSDAVFDLSPDQFAELGTCWQKQRETINAFYDLDAARRDGNLNERSLYRYLSRKGKQLLLDSNLITTDERELLEKDIHY
jgi:hypothetical protein